MKLHHSSLKMRKVAELRREGGDFGGVWRGLSRELTREQRPEERGRAQVQTPGGCEFQTGHIRGSAQPAAELGVYGFPRQNEEWWVRWVR